MKMIQAYHEWQRKRLLKVGAKRCEGLSQEAVESLVIDGHIMIKDLPSLDSVHQMGTL